MTNLKKDYYNFQNQKKKIFSKKLCMAGFLENCEGAIKKAHTLSKQKSIAPIVENNKFYVRGYDGSTDIIEGGFGNRAGVKNVTTFYGFCDKHDTELFSVFENENLCFSDKKILKKQCGLLQFRSLCKELYLKKASLGTVEERELVIEAKYKEMVIECIPVPGLTEERVKEDTETIRKQIQEEKEAERATLHAYKKGFNLSIKDLEAQLDKIRGQIKNENYNNIRYFIIKVPFLIDISFDTSVIPEKERQADLGGKVFEGYVVTTLFEENKTFICFVWNKGQHFCQKFMEEFRIDDIKGSLYSLAFSDSRELIIRKSWWDSLGSMKQEDIEAGVYSEYFGEWRNDDIESIKGF